MFNDLIKNVMSLGIITASDVERLTATELMLLIIERCNGLLNSHHEMDATLKALQVKFAQMSEVLVSETEENVRLTLNKWVQDGTMNELINEIAFAGIHMELDTKLTRGEPGSITNAMLSQEVRESMTGGSVAVVGKDAVLTENIADGQVTRNKLSIYRLDYDANLVSDLTVYAYGYMYNGEDGSKLYGEHLTLKLYKKDIDFTTIPIRFNMTSHVTFWDETDTFISGYIQGSLDNGTNSELLKNVPSNAHYVLFGFYKNRQNNAVVAKDNLYSNSLKANYYDDSLIVSDDNAKQLTFPSDRLTDKVLNPKGNLIDKTKLIKGKYYNISGNLVTADGAYMFEFDIDPNEIYRFNFESHVTFWDESDTFISGYIQGSLNGTNSERLYTVENTKKVRMLIFDSQVDIAIFALNQYFTYDLKTTYYIPGLIVENENVNNTQNKNPLYGKSMVFLGDSWCAGNTSSPGGWCQWIKNQNPTITAVNYGQHGADWNQGNLFFLDDEEKMAVIKGSDYIIIEAYTNGLYGDVSSLSKPLGSIDEFTYMTLEQIEALPDTYARDLEKFLFRIASECHGKKIGLMFPYKSVDHLRENNAFRHFRPEVIKCANKYNIPIFDNFNGCNIPSWDAEIRKEYYVTDDTVHLNAKGYSVICPPIENWIKTL